MGSKDSGRKDIFEIIRDAYLKASPDLPLHEIGIPYSYILILERWIFIDKIRSKDYPRKSTKEICTLWKRKFGLKSDQQFYIDKRNCERLFGETAILNKEYERKLALATYDTIISRALLKDDLRTAREALKDKIMLIGLTEKGDDHGLLSNVPNTYILQTNIVLDGKTLQKRNIDLTRIDQATISELKEISSAIDIPDASIEFMENEINSLDGE